MAAASTLPETPARAPAVGWDSRLFVIQGQDRVHLRERAGNLAAFAGRHPDAFAELAATLAAELAPGGLRLAVVARSASELASKLQRVDARLADPAVHAIRSSDGVYFSDTPLYAPGTLALLFPGEGAQYPGMLADLCGVFPEVEETFAWADQIAADAGRTSMRSLLESTGPTSLGPAILGVLLADLAVARVLQRLQLPFDAVAGHSAGEMAALIAAGAMDTQSLLGPELVDLMDVMDRQENEAGGLDCTLLAVGAGKRAVMEIADVIAPGAVIVAMDNCPHQCIAVGPTAAVVAVEAALAAKGTVCERLPVRRPYHTPLFEPWMPPFRALFDSLPFSPLRTPTYSCTTGERFPAEPDAVRNLAVEQWVRPVEFARMVERMHADGVRLFVEAGPGGMLSGFVEDVLRGQPMAAVPTNLRRTSGPTQVNRLAGQLLVHGVPLAVGELFSDVADRVEWEPRPAVPSHADPVMAGYFAAMEHFLDVQRDVFAAYFSGETPAPHAAEKPFAFVGEIVAHVPGESVVIRRTLDEREDRFGSDHALGGRGVSRVDPSQRGLPVLPMTVSLEAMAEAALLLAPGKVLIAVRNVRLRRWMPYDAVPTTLEVRAAIANIDAETGVVEVRADARDLGNSFVADGATKVAAEAVVVLADRYPEPPEPLPFELPDAVPCRSSIDDLRRNMFHGPLYQMLDGLGRWGRDGIEGTLTVAPRDGWLASEPEPRVAFDPILTDAAMHIIGGWHLEQPDWTGRILLPFEVQKLELFGPSPAAGERLVIRGHTEQESARHYRHGLEAFGPDGRVWLRLTGAGYWRFYLPFGHVNFYGPKDEYFLSRDWPEATLPTGRCFRLRPPADLLQPVLRMSGARVTLTPRELAEFTALCGNEAEINDWLFTRLLAKDAARAAWTDRHGERLFPADIETDFVDGRLVATPRGNPGPEPLPSVAVRIAGGWVVGFASFAPQVGLAVQVDGDRRAVARRAVADALRIDADSLVAAEPDATGRVLVEIPHRSRVVVQTAVDDGIAVATTLLEAAP